MRVAGHVFYIKNALITETKKSPAISHWAIKIWSGKKVSNLTHQPWKGCALPLKLFPH
jgi:hypothetical protein